MQNSTAAPVTPRPPRGLPSGEHDRRGARRPACAPRGRYVRLAVEDDRALLQRLRAGDEDAFQTLVTRHDAALRRVPDYREDALPDAERARMESHLADCEGRTVYLEDMRRLIGSLHAAPEPPPDPATREALLRAFRDLRPPG